MNFSCECITCVSLNTLDIVPRPFKDPEPQVVLPVRSDVWMTLVISSNMAKKLFIALLVCTDPLGHIQLW